MKPMSDANSKPSSNVAKPLAGTPPAKYERSNQPAPGFGKKIAEAAAEAIRRVAGIVRDRLDRHPVVVVSAMGKTTNKLLAAAHEAAAGRRDRLPRRGRR